MSDNTHPTVRRLTPSARLDLPQAWLYLRTQWRRGFGLNVSRIDDLLYVGGQFRPRQWPALRELGIRAVLSLQAEREDTFHGSPPERALRLLVPDFHAPTVEQIHEAVAFIQAAHAEQLPVLVHCHAGVGRASLTASAFLIASGMSHSEAFAQIRRARPIVALNDIQLARLIEWEQLVRVSQPAVEPQTESVMS
ncbi:MAG TPA: dual specificity protein phosphatase [Roseiflexaceae bacterium]|nr:dual specificity protein phosphatase [Roseiflexaceae bacterium]